MRNVFSVVIYLVLMRLVVMRIAVPCLVVISLIGATCPSDILAQTSRSEARNASFSSRTDSISAFSSLRFSASPGSVLWARNVSGWTPKPGAGIAIQTPFLSVFSSMEGELGVGAFAIPWTSHADSRPDFLAVHMFVQWSLSSPSRFPVKLTSGVSAGNYFMSFSSNQVAGERNESELALAGFLQIRRTIFAKIEGFVELRITRVYTRPKMDLLGAKVGLSLTMNAPNWLRTVAE